MVGFWGVVLLNATSLFTLSLLPIGASLGWPVLMWDLVGTVGSMLPVAYSVQILLRAYPAALTLYDAAASAGGPPAGAFVVLCEWAAAVTFTVPLLEFAALAFAQVVLPGDGEPSGAYLAVAVFVQMVLITALQLRGLEEAVWWLGGMALLGTVPLLGLGVGALIHAHALSPISGGGSLLQPAAAVVVFGFAGIEVTAFHLREIRAEVYMAAIVTSLGLVLILYGAGQLLMAALVPAAHLHLSNSFFLALRASTQGSRGAFEVLCCLTAVGTFASAMPWLLGPVRGLADLLGQDERKLIIVQNALCTCLGWIFLCTSASSGFWWLTAMAAATTQAMYLTLFYACVQTKRRDSGIIPVLVGMMTSSIGLFMGLQPPEHVKVPAMVFTSVIASVLAVLGASSHFFFQGQAGAIRDLPGETRPLAASDS